MIQNGVARGNRLTRDSIARHARRTLHAEGMSAITANGLGRSLGVTGPAIYRHFDNVGDLVDCVIGLVYEELCDRLDAVIRQPDSSTSLLEGARELRRWSLEYHHEFALLFSSPIPLQDWSESNPAHQGGRRFGRLFLHEFAGVLRSDPEILREQPECPQHLRPQIEGYVRWMDIDVSADGALLFLETWVRLYGHITMEAMGQLSYALPDMSVPYERLLRDIARILRLSYSDPSQT